MFKGGYQSDKIRNIFLQRIETQLSESTADTDKLELRIKTFFSNEIAASLKGLALSQLHITSKKSETASI